MNRLDRPATLPKPREATERIDLTLGLQLLTPMLGGGAVSRKVQTEDPIRRSAIRGHLRWWWRVAQQDSKLTPEALYRKETEIWGGPAKEGAVAMRAPVEIRVSIPEPGWGQADLAIPRAQDIDFYALWVAAAQAGRDGAPGAEAAEGWEAGKRFTLRLSYPRRFEAEVKLALGLWLVFGGVGGRTRRGLGSLAPTDAVTAALFTDPETLVKALPMGSQLVVDTLPGLGAGAAPTAPAAAVPPYMAPPNLPRAQWIQRIQQGYTFSEEQIASFNADLAYRYRQAEAARTRLRAGHEQPAPVSVPRRAPPLPAINLQQSREHWLTALGWLRNFRQQAGGSDQAARMPPLQGRPGRSRWPESDRIRWLVLDRRLNGKVPREARGQFAHDPLHAYNLTWPRAGFGLPLQFQFQQRSRGGQPFNPGDPAGRYTLKGPSGSNPIERWASRLIVKAAYLRGQVRPMALKLNLPIPTWSLVLSSSGGDQPQRNEATVWMLKAPDEPMEFKPLQDAHPEDDIIDIFLQQIAGSTLTRLPRR